MDSRRRRRPSSDRLLTAFPVSPPSSFADGDELSEDDIFFAGADFSNPPSTSSTPPSPSIHHRQNGIKSFTPHPSGVLAALPVSSAADCRRSVFNHKPVTSRMIPRPSSTMAVDRQIFSLPAKYHQAAPMNVPPLMMRDTRMIRKGSAFGYEDDYDDDDDDDDDGEMLPPHEIVARQIAKSPVLSCSVLEGAGRTLKGRDLRQVRNAVFRQTGTFLV